MAGGPSAGGCRILHRFPAARWRILPRPSPESRNCHAIPRGTDLAGPAAWTTLPRGCSTNFVAPAASAISAAAPKRPIATGPGVHRPPRQAPPLRTGGPRGHAVPRLARQRSPRQRLHPEPGAMRPALPLPHSPEVSPPRQPRGPARADATPPPRSAHPDRSPRRDGPAARCPAPRGLAPLRRPASDRRLPSIRNMEDVAWVLRTDNRTKKIGFVRTRDLKPADRFVLSDDDWS